MKNKSLVRTQSVAARFSQVYVWNDFWNWQDQDDVLGSAQGKQMDIEPNRQINRYKWGIRQESRGVEKHYMIWVER